MGTFLYSVTWLTGWTFLGLKLAGAVAWPWLLVLLPFIVAGGWTIFAVVFFIAVAGTISVAAVRQQRQAHASLARFNRSYGRRF